MMRWRAAIAVVFVFALASPVASAVAIGQVDTFSGGLANWFAGGGPNAEQPPIPPQVIATGGPGGPGDAFMQVTAVGGGGPGSRLVVMNAAQWAGNYVVAGIGSIEMDLRNLGTSDLSIRLLFEDPIPGPPENVAISTLAIFLPAGGAWVHASFDVTAGGLTALMGDLGTLLADTTILRIVHAGALAFPGEAITGMLGVDNIAAVARAVDEPATAWLFAAAALLALGLRRRS